MKTILASLAAVIVLSFSGNASAVSVSEDVEMIFAPKSVVKNAQTNNNKAQIFLEQTNLMLPTDLSVDAFQPGLYDASTAPLPRVLTAGNVVNSYFLHTDDGTSTPKSFSGSVTFDAKILGVIFISFGQSDVLLGSPGTSYETTSGRGLELADDKDSFRINNNRTRLDFNFSANSTTDQIRIITAVPKENTTLQTVPPSSLIALESPYYAATFVGQSLISGASHRGNNVDPKGNPPPGPNPPENPIPEPVTPILLGMGLSSLALRRRHTA